MTTMIVMLAETGNRVRERERDKHILTTQAWTRTRTRFPSKIYFSFDRSFVVASVRSIPETPHGRRTTTTTTGGEGRKGRSFVPSFVALPTCGGNLPLSLPPSLRPTASLHIGICRLLSPSPSPVWFSARMFEFTRKWAWQPASHVASGRSLRALILIQ